jgi:hypothetical protein
MGLIGDARVSTAEKDNGESRSGGAVMGFSGRRKEGMDHQIGWDIPDAQRAAGFLPIAVQQFLISVTDWMRRIVSNPLWVHRPLMGQSPGRRLQIECLLLVSVVRPFSGASVTAIGVHPPLSRHWMTGSNWDEPPGEGIVRITPTTDAGKYGIDSIDARAERSLQRWRAKLASPSGPHARLNRCPRTARARVSSRSIGTLLRVSPLSQIG